MRQGLLGIKWSFGLLPFAELLSSPPTSSQFEESTQPVSSFVEYKSLHPSTAEGVEGNPNPSAGKDVPAQDEPLSGDSIASTGERLTHRTLISRQGRGHVWPGNQGQQAPRASAPKPSKRPPPGVSKPRPPYVSGSFRSGGPGLLFAARGPRVEGPARAASTPGRWDRRVHVCSLAGVEGIGGTSSGGAVAAPWGALTMGEPCSNTQLGGKGRGEPRSSRRAPKARLCWGLCAAGGRTPLARLRHPEED